MAGDPRIVFVGTGDAAADAVERGAASYVVIKVPRGGLLRRARLDVEVVAEAIDAADDLAGEPRLRIDLSTQEGRAALSLG